MFPEKLYVEITTRCNMRCGMCVKHVPGSRISNRDMSFETFNQLTTQFPKTKELILNGLGEPLLHPDLDRMLLLARQHMPENSRRGFQTNGLLMTQGRAKQLIEAGLNLICISVDTAAENERSAGTLLHATYRPNAPFEAVSSARQQLGSNLLLGAEIVIVRETLPLLAKLVEQLAADGVDFIIGSHLLAYSPESEASNLFDTNLSEAIDHYTQHKKLAASEELDLATLTGKTWIAPRNDRERALKKRFKQMLREAKEQDIWINTLHLEARDQKFYKEAEKHYENARIAATLHNIDLDLPPLTATKDRSCRFMKKKTAFIDTDGFVMPCHFLWHDYTVYMQGEAKQCKRRVFGNLMQRSLDEIWLDDEYSEFRDHASEYQYPYCHSCSVVPCPDITGEQGPFINDCFAIPVPCGHCLWCYDAIRCL